MMRRSPYICGMGAHCGVSRQPRCRWGSCRCFIGNQRLCCSRHRLTSVVYYSTATPHVILWTHASKSEFYSKSVFKSSEASSDTLASHRWSDRALARNCVQRDWPCMPLQRAPNCSALMLFTPPSHILRMSYRPTIAAALANIFLTNSQMAVAGHGRWVMRKKPYSI